MPASPLKADIRASGQHVRFGPRGDIGSAANCSLFDHLISATKKCRWYLKTKSLRGLEVDSQFEFGRLQDRQIGRLGAVENFAGIEIAR
jgi:hypothetical protein